MRIAAVCSDVDGHRALFRKAQEIVGAACLRPGSRKPAAAERLHANDSANEVLEFAF